MPPRTQSLRRRPPHPLTRSASLPKPRKSRLSPTSAKRQGEREAREAVRRAVFARDGGECQAARFVALESRLGPCGGIPLTCHEVTKRSRRPGSHLDVRACLTLCGWHNAAVENEPKLAERLALSLPSWAPDDGLDARERVDLAWERLRGGGQSYPGAVR